MTAALLLMIKEYYSLPGNLAGGNLHLVLDDNNLGDSSIKVCLLAAVKASDHLGISICYAMLYMNAFDRQMVVELFHKGDAR